jgi:hypothetical protein
MIENNKNNYNQLHIKTWGIVSIHIQNIYLELIDLAVNAHLV